jgi:hypothetical protein
VDLEGGGGPQRRGRRRRCAIDPVFLKDAAKEGYRAHMDETPSGMLQYPYMVQYLLETYALDYELAKSYVTVSTARQLEGEDERAFGRRL